MQAVFGDEILRRVSLSLSMDESVVEFKNGEDS